MNANSKTFVAGAALAQKRLVKLSSGEVVYNTITSTDDPIGVNDYAVADTEDACILMANQGGTVELTAAGAITAGARIYAAADGKVSAIPEDSATYRLIGIALEAATADGDIIECLLLGWSDTEVVS